MSTWKPPADIIALCQKYANQHPTCYVYAAIIGGNWKAFARKTIDHARALLDTGQRVWMLREPNKEN